MTISIASLLSLPVHNAYPVISMLPFISTLQETVSNHAIQVFASNVPHTAEGTLLLMATWQTPSALTVLVECPYIFSAIFIYIFSSVFPLSFIYTLSLK